MASDMVDELTEIPTPIIMQMDAAALRKAVVKWSVIVAMIQFAATVATKEIGKKDEFGEPWMPNNEERCKKNSLEAKICADRWKNLFSTRRFIFPGAKFRSAEEGETGASANSEARGASEPVLSK